MNEKLEEAAVCWNLLPSLLGIESWSPRVLGKGSLYL